MTNRTKNHTKGSSTALVAILAIAALLTVAVTASAIGRSHSAFAQAMQQQQRPQQPNIDKDFDQKGRITDKAASDQDQECKTAGGGSGITGGSCRADAGNTAVETGGVLNEDKKHDDQKHDDKK